MSMSIRYGATEIKNVYNKMKAVRDELERRRLDVSAFAELSFSDVSYVTNVLDTDYRDELQDRYERWERTYQDYLKAYERGYYTWEQVVQVMEIRDIAKQDYERSTTNTNLFRKLETNMFVLNDWITNFGVEPLDWVEPSDRLEWNKTPTIERINMWEEFAQNYGQELGLW